MAVTAETQSNWLLAEQAFPEAELAVRRQLLQFLGGVAMYGSKIETMTPENANSSTLLSAIQMAALGDAAAYRVVEANVSTDMAERMYKAGHQTKVHLSIQSNKLQQEGRLLTDIHRNTLQYTYLMPEMLERTKSDIKNTLLIERLYVTGLLEKYDAAIFSTASTAMSQTEKKAYNFFTDTETCSIQLFSMSGGEVELETAFVAGKKTPASERHDIAAIQALTSDNGVQLLTTDGTAMLQHVLLVPKGELVNGVADIVKKYDDAAGGTFYGEAKPRQDYGVYAQQCETRNTEFGNLVKQLAMQLVAEAPALETPLGAIKRLDELSERLCVKYAVKNHHVNALVFGRQAAIHIEAARVYAQQGDEDGARQSLIKAQNTADSGSCPLYRGQSETESSSDNNTGNKESSGKKLMSCPYCGARVFDDPCAKVLSCWDCSALVINGAVKNKGNGGAKARREQQKAEAKRREAELAAQVEAAYAEVEADAAAFESNRGSVSQIVQPAGV